MTKEEYKAFKSAVQEIDEVKAGLVTIGLFGAGHRENEIELSQFCSEVERRKGHATKAMIAFLDLADEFQVDVVLTACFLRYEIHDPFYSNDEADRLHALNELGMNNDQLVEWYSRFGFTDTHLKEGDNPLMKRNCLRPALKP